MLWKAKKDQSTHFFLPFALLFLDFLEDLSFCCNMRFISLTSSIKKALTILLFGVKSRNNGIPVLDFVVSECATISSGDSSLARGESSKSWGSKSWETCLSLSCFLCHVMNSQFATWKELFNIRKVNYLGSLRAWSCLIWCCMSYGACK